MSSRHIPWFICAVWISLALMTFLVLDASSVRAWALMTIIGIIPAIVFLRLWNDGPPETVAELLHATETRR